MKESHMVRDSPRESKASTEKIRQEDRASMARVDKDRRDLGGPSQIMQRLSMVLSGKAKDRVSQGKEVQGQMVTKEVQNSHKVAIRIDS